MVGHEQRWLVLAPNSDRLPGKMQGEILQGVTGILAPSRWAEQVLRKLFPSLPVMHCPHGVMPEMAPDAEARDRAKNSHEEGAFNVVHLTSTTGQRKGTRELVDAWKMVQGQLGASPELVVVADPRGLAEVREWVDDAPNARVVDGLGFPAATIRAIYSRSHLVCQPSRAEGFGLVPLEARCCGVPVAATACTGHADHMRPDEPGCPSGTVVIAHGDAAPLDDLAGATAPEVTASAVAEALVSAHEGYAQLHDEALRAAPDLAARWTWTKRTGPALERLVKEAT